MNDGTKVVDGLLFVLNVIKNGETIGLGDGGYPKVAERRWMRPVNVIKPFGTIKGEYDDIRLDVFTTFPAANCLLSAGYDSNCESCKSFSSAMTSSTGSIMALSGDLKCLCLGESLNIYVTSRFILENELYSSQGKAKSVETAVHGKLEETSKPSFRS